MYDREIDLQADVSDQLKRHFGEIYRTVPRNVRLAEAFGDVLR